MIVGNRKLPSMFFQRGNALEYIRAGSAFRRTHKDKMVETAEITSVYTDSCGIPHVRFDVVFEKPHRPVHRDGPRILSLKTFFDTFRDRVPR
jgi:hypothetical protein